MSYESSEQSTMDGQPVELYHFYDEHGHDWRYTSYAIIQTFDGNDYLPEAIDREPIEQTDNHFKDEVQVKLGRNNPFAINYISGLLESKVVLNIYRTQGINSILYWSGVVNRVVFDENEIPTIKASPVTSQVVRVGARRRCQIMCDLPLYGPYCSVSSLLYTLVGTVTGVSGVTLSSATFGTKANDWLTGGMIIIGDAKRLIQWHQGTDIKISRSIANLVTGVNFTAYAGCMHTADVCHTKFSNKINYGGCEFLPLTNPFKSAVVY